MIHIYTHAGLVELAALLPVHFFVLAVCDIRSTCNSRTSRYRRCIARSD